MNLILVGFKRCGKTTIGQALAKQLNRPFLDTDALLLQKFKCETISDLFLSMGNERFRKEEMAILKTIQQKNGVISLGGGTFCEETKEIVYSLGRVLYLKLSKEEVVKRLTTPPLPSFIHSIDPKKDAEAIFETRSAFLEKFSHYTEIVSDSKFRIAIGK